MRELEHGPDNAAQDGEADAAAKAAWEKPALEKLSTGQAKNNGLLLGDLILFADQS